MKGTTSFLAISEHVDSWEDAIRCCGAALMENGKAGPHFIEACLNREVDYPTGLPSDIPVAIPHGSADDIVEDSICFLRTDEPVRFRRMDDDEQYCDTRLVFNIAIKSGQDHLSFLQRLMNFAMDTNHLEQCLALPIEQIPDYLDAHLQ